MRPIDETHDPGLRCWVHSAHREGTDFPIQNLPFGIFRRRATSEAWRGGVAIGSEILDLGAAAASGAFHGEALVALHAATSDSLNALMALGPQYWRAVRFALSRALREGSSSRDALAGCLIREAAAELALPARIGDYTDFYTSLHHATNVGRLFRPDNPLLPNYKWVPIGYHGRASSVVISGVDFRRPVGQVMPPGADRPVVRASGRIDIELELGAFVGPGNALGEPIPIATAEDHVFGLVLLNDWSARDIQPWEYQPLGPFLAKNFATTISPWIVTLEALAPFRLKFERPPEDPPPLPYLDCEDNRSSGVLDIRLAVLLETAVMRARQVPAMRLALSNSRHAYWTLAQLVAHHTVGGCNLRPGDLLGTGTLSGPDAGEAGALLEMTAAGKEPIALPDGEVRTFLEDGDTVTLEAWCERPGAARIGFGHCRATVLPARIGS